MRGSVPKVPEELLLKMRRTIAIGVNDANNTLKDQNIDPRICAIETLTAIMSLAAFVSCKSMRMSRLDFLDLCKCIADENDGWKDE